MAIRREVRAGIGWLGAVVLTAAGIAAGVGIDRWARPQGASARAAWKDVDELHQMYLAPGGYNFVESNKSYETQLLSLIHDSLLVYDPVKDQLVPGLARRYDVSPDGLLWTFHLREAHTPDGEALSAEDVVFSVNLCLNEDFQCNKRGNLIVNKTPVEARSAGPLTVTFRLAEPFHSFAWAVAGVSIVPKATFAPVVGNAADLRRAVGVQQPELKFLKGFGPYFVESRDTQEVKLARNEKFWGRGDEPSPRPFLKRITLVLHNEDVTSGLDFERDDRYAYRSVAPMEAGRLREDPNFQVLDRGRGGNCFFFWVNQNPRSPWAKTSPGRMALFQKVEFRRALAHAIDRNDIIRRVFKGDAFPIYGPVSPIFHWTAPTEELLEVTPKLDPPAAVAELAALGVKPGEPDASGKRWLTHDEGGKRVPLEIEIRTSKSQEDQRRKIAEEIKSQLEAIGVRVKVVEEGFGDMVARLDQTFDYEAAMMSLEGMPDAAVLRFFFESSGPMHFVNPYQKSPATEWERRVDEAYKRYATSPDPSVRDGAIIDVQKTWVSAQPAFHLINDRKLVAVRRDYEVNGMALTGRAADPILQRTVVESVRVRRLVPQ